jgi:hypothetical protein
MKSLLLIISVLLFINDINAQGQKDTLDYSEISKVQQAEWDETEYMWWLGYYNPFLKKHKLKPSCANCTSIIFEAIFCVDEKGKTQASLISENVCGRKFSKKQKAELLQLLEKIVFPKVFYDGTFKFRIGRALKC